MKKNNKIIVSHSCNEVYNKMKSLNSKDRLCSKCNLKVTDFRAVNEINITSPICGKFKSEQVETIRRKNIIENFSRPISLVALLGITLLPLNSNAQEHTNHKTNVSINQSSDTTFTISGKLIDQKTKETLPFVNIEMFYKDSYINSITTDFEGVFKLYIDTEKYPLSDLTLVINSVGYSSDTTNISNKENLIIELESDIIIENYEVLGYILPNSDSKDSTAVDGHKIEKRKRKKK